MAVPTGGAVIFSLPDYSASIPPSGVTTITISRAVSGSTGLSAFTTIYSGAPCSTFVDAGEALPRPLDPTLAYVWQVTDARGTTQTTPVVPAQSITTGPDYLTNLLIRLLQGSLDSATLPPGFAPPTGGRPVLITTKMPQQGLAAMPFIIVNLDLIQQSETQIGEDVNASRDNNWALFVNAKRIWRVSVFSQDANERDFYRDSLLVFFRVLKATVFSPLGLNVTHSFQAASFTDANAWDGHSPGFYGADLMLEIDGVFNTTILTNYGLIQSIAVNPTIQGQAETSA